MNKYECKFCGTILTNDKIGFNTCKCGKVSLDVTPYTYRVIGSENVKTDEG